MAFSPTSIGLATVIASVAGLVAFTVAEGVRILAHSHNGWTMWSDIPLFVCAAVGVVILAATIPMYGLDGLIGTLVATPVIILGGRFIDRFVGDEYEQRT